MPGEKEGMSEIARSKNRDAWGGLLCARRRKKGLRRVQLLAQLKAESQGLRKELSLRAQVLPFDFLYAM